MKDFIENYINFPLYMLKTYLKDIERWIAHRTYDKCHVVKTDLKPGYYDIDTRMLHSNFTLLVDFVEIDKASLQYFFTSHERTKKFGSRVNFNNLTKAQKKELGLQYLDWEINTDEPFFPEIQRDSAKETKELYLWWTDVRPSRIDPYDKYKEELNKFGESIYKLTVKDIKKAKKVNAIFKKIGKLEEQYDKEDETMLIRLMKVRRSLWT